MNITNEHNLPPEIVAWLRHDDYDYRPGVMSATGIMKPIRAVVLQRRHGANLSVDVSSFISMRYGTAIHDSFENIHDLLKPLGIQQEQRYVATIGEYQISGKFDMLKTLQGGEKQLQDIKSTSVWKFTKNQDLDDYKTQLSIYRWILSKNNILVTDEANIIFFFTDWMRSKVQDTPGYPPLRIAVKPLPLWTLEETETYILSRLQAFDSAKDTPDDSLPECTDAELWRTEIEFAVIKKGGMKATKNFKNDEAGAKAMLAEKGSDYEIRTEGGMVKRCPEYCPCYTVCNQYKKLKEQGFISE